MIVYVASGFGAAPSAFGQPAAPAFGAQQSTGFGGSSGFGAPAG